MPNKSIVCGAQEYDDCVKAIDLFVSKDYPQCELNAAFSTLLPYIEKMKIMGCTKIITVEKLIKLLTVMEDNTKSEAVLLKRKSEMVWLGPSFETINKGADGSLISLFIMTSSEMPQRIFIDNFISKILSFIKFQLQNTMYPNLSCVTIDKKRKNSEQTNNMNQLLNKLLKLISMLSELLNGHILSEPLLIHVSSICISSLYVENATSIQIACLKLSAVLFKKFEFFRTTLLLDISTSVKTDLNPKRCYIVSDEKCIQIFTALVMQLIQCSALPNSALKKSIKKLISDSYQQVSSIFHAFLYLTFKNAHQSKLFQTFIEDILRTVNLPDWPCSILLLKLLGTIFIKHITDNNTDATLKVSSLNYICIIAIYLKQNSILEVDCSELVKSINEKVRRKIELKENVLLQQVLMDFLAVRGQSDETSEFARQFYIAHWYVSDNIHSTELKNKKSSQEELYKLLQANIKPFNKTLCSTNDGDVYEAYVDFNCASRIATYLNNYDVNQTIHRFSMAIFSGLQDASIQVRAKALKCLMTIIQADPSILSESNVESCIKSFLLDPAISLRETTLELISKVIVNRFELVDKYYDAFSTRILDTAVSVRKKVIKILWTICLKYPNYAKISDIYIKLIRRINDEESIKKLIVELFLEVWFTPVKETLILQKVGIITSVFDTCKEVDFVSFKSLLSEMMKLSSTKLKELLLAFEQILDVLIDNLLKLTEGRVTNINIVYIFVKMDPEIAVKHSSVICKYFSFLTQNCKNKDDVHVIAYIVKIVKLIIPLIGYTNQKFLYKFENDLLQLVHQQEPSIIRRSLSCLSLLINNFTHNYTLITDCFNKYWNYLIQTEIEDQDRLLCRRSIFILGFLLRYFDLGEDSKNKVVALFFDFLQNDEDIQLHTLKALGSMCIRYWDINLEDDLKKFYCQILVSPNSSTHIKSQVLINIELFLQKQDKKITKKSFDYKRESLKEMKDVESGMTSTIIQQFLKEILTSYLSPKIEIRLPALQIIKLILQQGLVQPSQIIPYLICMSTDFEEGISNIANNYLSELEMKYPGCVYTKSYMGLKLSYELQTILKPDVIVRGFKICNNKNYPSSVNASLFHLLKHSKHRLGLIFSMVKQFEEQAKCNLPFLLYLADNLAYFPYKILDDIMYVIRQSDSIISLSGANILQSFQEGLIKVKGDEQKLNETIEDCDIIDLISKLPEDVQDLHTCLDSAHNCLLLLLLKQHLKCNYGLNDTQIQQYNSLNQTKSLDKTITCKKKALFEPKKIIDKLNNVPQGEDERTDLIRRYLEFKKIMFDLDEVVLKNGNDDSINKNSQEIPKRAQKRKSSLKKKPKKKSKKRKFSDSSCDSDESFVL